MHLLLAIAAKVYHAAKLMRWMGQALGRVARSNLQTIRLLLKNGIKDTLSLTEKEKIRYSNIQSYFEAFVDFTE